METRIPKHVRRHRSGKFRAVVARGDGTRWHGPLRSTPTEAAVDAARFRGTVDTRGAITLQDALALVLLDLEHSGARPATVAFCRRYVRVLATATPIWDMSTPLASLDHAQVRAYVDLRQEAGVAMSTIWGKEIQTLGRVVACALRAGKLLVDPLAGLKRPRIRSKRFSHLVAEQIAAIRARVLAPRDGASRYQRERDAAILDLCFGTGMRRAEMARLRVADVDFDTGQVLVDGKTGVRAIPLEGLALSAARRLAEGRGPLQPLIGHYVTIQRAFARIVAVGGIAVSPHVLRHSFASDCARRGVEPLLLSSLLGHRSLNQVLTYFHASADKARAAIRGVGDHR